jgi:menaquinol-cytochrome c reductase iron-sulfur subunit
MTTASGGAGGTGRRKFAARVLGALAAAGGAILAVPGVAHLLEPVLRRTSRETPWRPLAEAKVLESAEQPVALPVIGAQDDAWTRSEAETLGTVWVRKDDAGKPCALSAECPHLGCRIGYDGEKKNFVCPCHDSAFTLEGKVIYGPSPRGMDELEARVEAGKLEVRFVRFQTQIKDKVEV